MKDHKQSYKWQEKQNSKEEHFDKPWLEKVPTSFKKIGLNKYEMKIKIVYRPEIDPSSSLSSWWLYNINNNNDLIQKTDIVLWEEKINWYVKLNSKKKIDWLLTKDSKFQLKEKVYNFKGNEIGGFSNIAFVEEDVYKLYLREKKLERIISNV